MAQNNNVIRPSFYNCIAWGNSVPVSYGGGQVPRPLDFVNCAIQGTLISNSTTNCISLSAANGDPSGPNFNAIDGSNWSIKFISPCRDAGISSYPAVPNDYLGNFRIYNFDIGAYEVQYSRWTGTTDTDWATATNWDKGVAPSLGTGDVIIPKGLLLKYPIASAPDFTIGTGKTMILEPEAKASIGTLANNGTLKLEADADSVSSLIVSTYSGNNAIIELYLSGQETSEINKWHYISSPVSSLSTNVFTVNTNDLAQYVESLPTLSNEGLIEGWIAYDGYNYALENFPVPVTNTFNNLIPGKGYNYFCTTNFKYSFSGALNTSNVPIVLGYSGIPSLHGFNLLGNPFSSGLNWDEIVNSTLFTYPGNTSKSVFFTRDDVQCTYANGVGVPADVNGIIPPMQGFFTKTYSTGNTITLSSAARTHTDIHARYKGAAVIPLVRLSIGAGSFSDETVVRFDNLAKSGFDYDFDAVKMFISAARILQFIPILVA